MTPQKILEALYAGKISIDEAKEALKLDANPSAGQGTPTPGRLQESEIVGTGNTPVPKVSTALGRREAIAIVGMSGRYPDAKNLAEYWDNLVQGKNAIREIPPTRFDVSNYYDPNPATDGKIYCKWLGALDEIEYFDPLFFHIAPADADAIDPQHRLFLEEGYKAFEDAGYSPQLLSNRKCGVYLGLMSHEYDLLLHQHNLLEINLLGTGSAIAAARIAYLLNLKGPAICIDTACSSSLVATHLACQALASQEIDMALVGGVSLYLTLGSYVGMCSAGMLSPDGQCKAFDASANGFVPGEGAGALVLKRLADAEADHDQIYGVIIGSGMNQDGTTNGITAPSTKSQIDLEREIYERYQIDPASISYVEMHGTGTKLGDPIELEALATVLQEKTQRKQYCAIGSVKSNIGHTSAAAGVASVQKVLLAIKQKKLVPTLHFQQPNAYFDFAASPFYVNTEVQDWKSEAGTPRRAAVSSFGLSGTNAHLVIEEYVPERRFDRRDEDKPYPETPCLFVLSAKSEKQLKSYAQDMKSWIQAHSELVLADIAFTLQLGRAAMDHRLAIVADSHEILLQRLEGFVNNHASAGVYTAQVKHSLVGGTNLPSRSDATLFEADEDAQSLLRIWCQKKNLAKIAQAWVKGANVDWELLYTNVTEQGQALPQRVSLPTYPFAKERYWCTQLQYPQTDRGNRETLMLQPCWREEAICHETSLPNYEKHVVMLCEPDELSARLAKQHIVDQMNGVDCLILQAYQPDIDKRFQEYVTQAFWHIKNIIVNKPRGRVLIQIVVPHQEEQQPLAGLSGLLASAQRENPKLSGQLIELAADTQDIAEKLQENRCCLGSQKVRYRDDKRWVADWCEVEDTHTEEKCPWKDGGIYLITGGAGGLGLIFAHEIANRVQGATLVLTGRSMPTAEKQAQIKQLCTRGTRVIYEQVDVTQKQAVFGLIRRIQQDYGHLDGIIHSAGVLHDNFILKKTQDEIEQVLAPKVTGLVNLDQASKDVPLDFFLLFSSISGAFGNVGQTDYSAANAFMDGYARYRNSLVASKQRQGETLSINWPWWKDGGMSIDVETAKVLVENIGMVAMETQTGIQALYRGLALAKDQVLIFQGNPSKMKEYRNGQTAKAPSSPEMVAHLQVVPDNLREKVIQQLKVQFSAITKLSVAQLATHEPLENYGIDSTKIIQLNQRLAGIFGELSKTLFFEYRTLEELAAYFVEDHQQACIQWIGLKESERVGTGVNPVRVEPKDNGVCGVRRTGVNPVPTRSSNGQLEQEPIAIIGIAGRYPQARKLKDYWKNLKAGRDCITEILPERWPLEGFYHADFHEAIEQGKSYSKWGGFVEGFADFDPLFFHMSPREALSLDPQERLFIETCWEALEDAGYTSEQLAIQCNRKVGVFAGITQTGFNLYGPDLWKQGKSMDQPQSLHPYSSFSSVANRVSYLLNLQGPSMPIDTMCSSSLTALHEAVEHIHRGECQMALAGGVNLYLHPSNYIGLCAHKMLSVDGQCKSFGEGGNGFVPGEGVGVVLLKRLSRAVVDHDQIYAVIRATGINHSGATNGYTVPNPTAQGELIRTTLDKAGVHARTVSYIEAHGTGTELGDPIEMTGLTQAFHKDTQEAGFCSLGSVKSNIGHLEAAAGIAGVTKTLLQMKHQQIVPSLHTSTLNPHINFAQTPFVVQQELADWKRPQIEINGETRAYPRIAGISSFGAGGANAHVVLEEYVPDTRHQSAVVVDAHNPAIVVLSARNEEQLKQQVQQLLEEIVDQQFSDEDLANIAYTLQVGREAMEERLAVVAESVNQLVEKLEQFIEGQDGSADVYRGQVKHYKETLAAIAMDEDMEIAIDTWVAKRKYHKLLDLWVKGLAFDWNKLYGDNKPYRISLPTYPFAREHLWITGSDTNLRSEWQLSRRGRGSGKEERGESETDPASPSTLPGSEDFQIPTPERDDDPAKITSPNVSWYENESGGPTEQAGTTSTTASASKPHSISLQPLSSTPFTGRSLGLSRRGRGSGDMGWGSQTDPASPSTMTQSIYQKARIQAPGLPVLEEELTKSLAQTLFIEQKAIDIEKPFIEIGLDSVIGVEWIQSLNKQYGLSLPTTKVYDHPTIRQLASFLQKELQQHQQTPVQSILPLERPGVDDGLTPSRPLRSPLRSNEETHPTYQRVIIERPGEIDDLTINEAVMPELKEKEICIAVHAFSLNFGDLLCVKGLYPTMPPYPFTPGFEASGVVLNVGRAVTAFKIGDPVIALAGPLLGGHANALICLEEHVFHKPATLSFEEACALPVVAITMIAAFEKARLKRGEKILIQTATGGTGLIAIQLANHYGAQIYATAGSQIKLDYLKQLGVPYRINYQATDFEQEIRRMTEGQGVDVVINTLPGDAIQKGMNCLASGGRYIEIAMTALKSARTIDLSVLSQNQTFYSVDLRRFAQTDPATLKFYCHQMLQLVEQRIITPTICQVFDWERLKDAYRYMENRQHIGKIVVRIPQADQVGHIAYKQRIDTTPPLQREQSSEPLDKRTNTHQDQTSQNAIAIIGMSGQFPKAKTLAEFWDNLAQGADCISEVPATRWSIDTYYDADPKALRKSHSKWMGVLEDADKFDPFFFKISPGEAEYMDPQQRVFLESCWHCIEDAGLLPSALSGSRCSVFVGCVTNDYGHFVFEQGLNAHGLMGNATSILSSRIAYLLNLKGPALAIDSACSSSLVAIAQACNSLVLRTSDLALAGGVCVIPGPSLHVTASQAGTLSPNGRCFTFDRRANGLVPGEGVGVVLLKRLSDAVRDGDSIHGVIRGWGTNQDGKTNGITAPSADAQTLLEQEVYQRFGINPATISLIEAHGTATKLGDPIEVEALTKAFQSGVGDGGLGRPRSSPTDNQKYCALGSVKSNIGHLMNAAGMAGVIKVLLALKHQMLPPTINFTELNEHISLDNTPFYINTQLRPWEVAPGTPRRAAVTALGFSGTNAHLVIEEYIGEMGDADETFGTMPNCSGELASPTSPSSPASTSANQGSAIIFTLSAKSEEQLKTYAERMRSWIASYSEPFHLADLAYTLQIGREAMDFRLAFSARSQEDLLKALEGFIHQSSPMGVFTGQVRKNTEQSRTFQEDEEAQSLLQSWVEKGKLAQIAELWVNGFHIDWQKIYADRRPRRINLPTYPFARESYWILPPRSESKTETAIPAISQLLMSEKPLPVSGQPSRSDIGKADEILAFTTSYLVNAISTVLKIRPEKLDPQVRFDQYGLDSLIVQRLKAMLEEELGPIPAVTFFRYKCINDLAQYFLKEHTQPIHTLFQQRSPNNEMVPDPSVGVGGGVERGGGLGRPHSPIPPQDRASIIHQIQRSSPDQRAQIESLHAALDQPLQEMDEILVRLLWAQLQTSGWFTQPRTSIAELKARVGLPTCYNRWLDETITMFAQRKYLRYDALSERVSDPISIDSPLRIWSEWERQKVVWLANPDLKAYVVLVDATLHALPEILTGQIPATAILFPESSLSLLAGIYQHNRLADFFNTLLADTVIAYLSETIKIERAAHLRILEIGAGTGGTSAMIFQKLRPYQEYIQEYCYTDISQAFLWHAQQSYGPQHPYLTYKIFNVEVPLADQDMSPNSYDLVIATNVFHATRNIRQALRNTQALLKPHGLLLLNETSVKSVFLHLTFGLLADERPYEDAALRLPGTPYLDWQTWQTVLQQAGFHRFFFPAPEADKLGQQVIVAEASNNVDEGENVGEAGKLPPMSLAPISEQDIAIIGMSGHYPQADNLDTFWSNLESGRDCIVEIPLERWDYRRYYQPKDGASGKTGGMYCKWGGFLPDIDKFDPLFFHISPREARFMDPQERLFLQNVAACFEDAGYSKHLLRDESAGDGRANVGVFAGVSYNNYQLYLLKEYEKDNLTPVNSQTYSIANRISYIYNLRGPSITLDTACSSSMVAIHLACASIKRGECAMAIAGGVNLSLHPSKYTTLCAAQFASSNGHCRSFGQDGDGAVAGEGVGAVLLKPLRDAIADGDHIYAIIKGTAVNNDGKTFGYSVPNPVAQTEVIRNALEMAHVDPRTISYVEAHGTGTKLGDPIEIAGLSDAFKEYTSDKQFCAIGSVKSNIGHLEAAAGISQVTKVVLQMKHKKLVPSLLHTPGLNPHIDFANTPFFVQRTLEEWKQPVLQVNGKEVMYPRRAGISSFGAGGVNVHVVIEEYQAKDVKDTHYELDNQPVVIILSAEKEQNLHDYAQRLQGYIKKCLPSPEKMARLKDIAYTLQTGRDPLLCRLAFTASKHEEVIEKLEIFLNHRETSEKNGLYIGHKTAEKQSSSKVTEDDLQTLRTSPTMGEKLAELWASGREIDWESMYQNERRLRVPLPTYPFSKERYWAGDQPQQPRTVIVGVGGGAGAAAGGFGRPPRRHRKQQRNPVVGVGGGTGAAAGGLGRPPRRHRKQQRNLAVGVGGEDDAGRGSLTDSVSPLAALGPKNFLIQLCQALPGERQEIIEKYLQDLLARLLAFNPPDVPELHQGFFDMGMESVLAERFRVSLEELFLIDIADTVIFDCPNISELSEYIVKRIPFSEIEKQHLTQASRQEKTLFFKEKNGEKSKEKEPIAIIGMGCRFPGGCHDPETFWRFLTEGSDGIIEVPRDRFRIEDFYDPDPNATGKIYLKEAGFLQENVGDFDARFFGISPREAADMDPQQRLLLEVSWEALERAGIPANQLKGTQTGVFIGIAGYEYAFLLRENFATNPYALTGCMPNIASGRIAYILGVHGPAISIDTACSSSLVAVHLACESLQRGESSLALAGGVSLMLAPDGFLSLCALHALAKDGRCKTFDADGDGYGRGEGCGVVVLKRLSDALRDNDLILAVIKGTGVNQDGPGSGLTVPNGKAQKALILKTLEVASVSPEDTGYFEVHGTGTALGDPIELQALTEVFGKDNKREKPLYVGSVKSNIGHLEAAAGIASLIKSVLCLQNQQIPPNLHLHKVNPKIRLERIPATVPQEVTPWETTGKPRIAGISSFGFSGTNAHVIVSEREDASDDALHSSCERPWHILALSAKDEKALSQVIASYGKYFDQTSEERLENICFTASAGRSHFPYRIAFIAKNMEQMKNAITAYLHGNKGEGSIEGKGRTQTHPKLAFLIHGKISPELAQSLFETQPTFQKNLRACNEQLQQLANISLLENTPSGERIGNVNTTAWQDDVLSFTLHFSLLKLWEAWGIRPNAVLGSKSGELVAACAAGIMDMETAFGFILEQGGVTDKAAGEKALHAPQIRVISGRTGRPVEKQEALSHQYWEAVLSGELDRKKGMQSLHSLGYTHFLQTGLIDDSDERSDLLPTSGVQYFLSVTEVDPWRTLTNTLANLYCLGLDIDWSGFEQGYSRRKVILPTYPFQRKYFWFETSSESSRRDRGSGVVGWGESETDPSSPPPPNDNPLDGRLINSPIKTKQIEYCLNLEAVPDVKDTDGVLHVGYYLEILCRAVKKLYHTTVFRVQTIDFLMGITISESETATLSLTLNTKESGEVDFSFFSHQGDGNWNKHTQGTILLNNTDPGQSVAANWRSEITSRCTDQYSGTEFYHQMQERDLFAGEGVQWIEQVWSREGEALARLRLPRSLKISHAYEMGAHPGVIDACAQLFHATLSRSMDKDMKYIVTKWEGFTRNKLPLDQEFWCHVVLQDGPRTRGQLEGRFQLFDQNGMVVAQICNGIMKGLTKERVDAVRNYLEQAKTTEGLTSESKITSHLSRLSQDQWRGYLNDYLQQVFAQILKVKVDELSIDEALMDLGMDSLVGVEAKTKVEKELGIFLPLELLIVGPSIRELTESILPLPAVKPSQTEGETRDTPLPTYKMDIAWWIVYRKSKPQAKVKLFCLPYGGGGGASLYRGWQAMLPDYIEVCPIQLPGKENRLKEQAFTDMGRAIDVLKQVLLPELDRPYAFYGHSMGAHIAYRLAYKLWSEMDNKPAHLFVGAYSSPTIVPNPFFSLIRGKFKEIGYADIPDAESLSSITPEKIDEILMRISSTLGADIELQRLLLPTTLAELQMARDHKMVDKVICDIPVTAFHGEMDDKVTASEMNAWQQLTQGPFALHTLPGDHLFLHENQDQKQLLALLAQELEKYQ